MNDHRHRLSPAALATIAVAMLFWTIYASLSQYNLDTHGDMVENYAWGVRWQWGYPKHPPLFGWVTAAWFSVLPVSDWAYYLLSAANSGLALLAGLLFARRFLTPGQQLVAVCLAQFLPPLGFLALKYNANSAMLPLWNAAFLFYLRALERRRTHDAAAFGAMCGLALLTKYMSATFILALVLFTLADHNARKLLSTPLPVVAAIAGAVVVLPHILWLVNHDFVTIAYAAGQGDGSFGRALGSVGTYAGAVLAYSLPALLVLLALSRSGGTPWQLTTSHLRALTDSVGGRGLLSCSAGPFVLTLLLGVASMAILSSPWSIPYFAPFPFVAALLVPAGLAHVTGRRAAAVAAGAAIVGLAAAPFIQSLAVERSRAFSALPLRELARQSAARFRQQTGTPLQLVSGLPVAANGTVFYADATYAVPMGDWKSAPSVDRSMLERHGAVHICLEDDADCLNAGRAFLEQVEFSWTLDVSGPAGRRKERSWRFIVLGRRPAT